MKKPTNHDREAEIEALSKILSSEQMDDIEEAVEIEKAAQRYRELLEGGWNH